MKNKMIAKLLLESIKEVMEAIEESNIGYPDPENPTAETEPYNPNNASLFDMSYFFKKALQNGEDKEKVLQIVNQMPGPLKTKILKDLGLAESQEYYDILDTPTVDSFSQALSAHENNPVMRQSVQNYKAALESLKDAAADMSPVAKKKLQAHEKALAGLGLSDPKRVAMQVAKNPENFVSALQKISSHFKS